MLDIFLGSRGSSLVQRRLAPRFPPHRRSHRPWPLAARLPSAAGVGVERTQEQGAGQVGHSRLPRRRPVASRQLRSQARRPRRDSRQVQADRHQRARPARRRTAAAHGEDDGQGRPGPLAARTTTTITRPRPTGCCPAASAPRSATIPPSAPWSPTRPASPAACRPMSPFRAIRRSPGNWARARSSAAVTSRSRPAIPTQADYKVQDLTPLETLTAKQAERRQNAAASRRWRWRRRSKATIRSPPTTSSTSGPPR